MVHFVHFNKQEIQVNIYINIALLAHANFISLWQSENKFVKYFDPLFP